MPVAPEPRGTSIRYGTCAVPPALTVTRRGVKRSQSRLDPAAAVSEAWASSPYTATSLA